MENAELIKALKEDAEWAHANERIARALAEKAVGE
jgi:hypothetical protein